MKILILFLIVQVGAALDPWTLLPYLPEVVKLLRSSPEKIDCTLNCFANENNLQLKKQAQDLRAKMNNQDSKQIDTEYDAVLEINSVQDIGTTGWKILYPLNPKLLDQTKIKLQNTNGVIVGVIGDFDVGKTFIINRVSLSGFPSSYKVETKGLSFMLPKKPTDLAIYLDSAGAKRCVEDSMLKDRLTTDTFIQELVMDLAQILLIVVGPLQTPDQDRINKLIMNSVESRKIVIVIHNFQHYYDNEVVDRHIKQDIELAFIAEFQEIQGPQDPLPLKSWISHKGTVKHFVFAAEGSEAGDKWNDQSTRLLENAIKGWPWMTQIKILNEIQKKVELLLPEYFYEEKPENSMQALTLPPPSKWIWDFDASGVKRKVLNFLSFVGIQTASPEVADQAKVDPFRVIYDEQNTRFILESPKPLIYMPFNMDSNRPDAFYEPNYDIPPNDGTKWTLYVDVPGFKECDIKFGMTPKGVLWITGTRPAPNDYEDLPLEMVQNRVIKKGQRNYGGFRISFQIPVQIDKAQVIKSKSLENGVLSFHGEIYIFK